MIVRSDSECCHFIVDHSACAFKSEFLTSSKLHDQIYGHCCTMFDMIPLNMPIGHIYWLVETRLVVLSTIVCSRVVCSRVPVLSTLN